MNCTPLILSAENRSVILILIETCLCAVGTRKNDKSQGRTEQRTRKNNNNIEEQERTRKNNNDIEEQERARKNRKEQGRTTMTLKNRKEQGRTDERTRKNNKNQDSFGA